MCHQSIRGTVRRGRDPREGNMTPPPSTQKPVIGYEAFYWFYSIKCPTYKPAGCYRSSWVKSGPLEWHMYLKQGESQSAS